MWQRQQQPAFINKIRTLFKNNTLRMNSDSEFTLWIEIRVYK